MPDAIWTIFGLVIGTGLVFSTSFYTTRGKFWKAIGSLMIMISTFRLAELLGGG